MIGFIKEFKEFAVKGNMIDLAIGIIIGGAFGKIVSSLVNDIIMPPLGLLIGGVDFADKTWVLKEALGESPAVVMNWGLFLNNVLDFVIVAFTIFVVIKQMNRLKKKEEEEKVEKEKHPTQIELLTEIRDSLKKES